MSRPKRARILEWGRLHRPWYHEATDTVRVHLTDPQEPDRIQLLVLRPEVAEELGAWLQRVSGE